MTYKTHIAFAGAISLYPLHQLQLHHYITPAQLPTLLGALALGAVMPDIDHTRSYISNKVPILPYIFAFYTKHRGFTHSLFGLAVVALLLFAIHRFKGVQTATLAAFWFGYLLHIAGDALTLSGIKNFCCDRALYLFPRFLRFRTGSFGELVYFFLFSAAAGYEYLLFFDPTHMPDITRHLHTAIDFFNSLL